MRQFALFLMISLLLQEVQAQSLGFEYDGVERTYLVHLPENYSELEELPLVIAMHGGGGSAGNLQNQSGLSDKADEEGFIVVYPEGIQNGVLNIRTWNAGWCCGNASSSEVDDVGFIEALLDTLNNSYAIDENRIYATGMSNGGFMAYRLALELSDRIAAIAPVAASMSMASYVPERAVPIIHFHSYLDSNVPLEGGIGDGISDHYNSPVDSVLNSWADINNCQIIQAVVFDNDEFTQIQWTNCDCSVDIQLYITKDGGHSWPGGTRTAIGDPPSEYINANDLMWNFFMEHSLDCNPTSIEEKMQDNEQHLRVYPNPTTDIITIDTPVSWEDFRIRVYNPLGKCVLTSEKVNQINLSGFEPGIYFIQIQSLNSNAILSGFKVQKN